MASTLGRSSTFGRTAEGSHEWVSPKKRSRPSPIHAANVSVSRESGMESNRGTFGNSQRFDSKIIGKGKDSPAGSTFYSKNSQYMLPSQGGLSCTLGFGERHDVVPKGSRHVGPGSYDVVASAASRKTSLDGPDYCSTTIKGRLKSMLVPANSSSPGPHAKYQTRKPPGHGLPSPTLKARHYIPSDTIGPGPGQYDCSSVKSIAASTSCPALRSSGSGLATSIPIDAVGGTKQNLKTTFGIAERFPSAAKSCSPTGDMYYDHFKFPSKEDYLGMSRSCSFGRGHKTDFTNPHRGHRLTTSPTTYSPNTSTTMKTSALDGFASRNISPIHSHLRSTTNRDKGSRKTFSRNDNTSSVSAFMSNAGTELIGQGGNDTEAAAA